MGEGFFDKVDNVIQGKRSASSDDLGWRVSSTGDTKLNNGDLNRLEDAILRAIKRHEPASPNDVVKDTQIKFTYEQVMETMIRFKKRGWIIQDSPH